MRRFIPFLLAFAAASALAFASQFGGPGLQRGLTDARFKQLTQSSSSAYPGCDNVPRVFIRFDDGRDDLVERAGVDGTDGTGIGYSAARRGMPFGIALNYSFLGSAGYVSVAQVQNLINYAEARGGQVEIMQHGNTNFAGAGSVANATGDSFKTYERLQSELRVTNLEAAFGKKVRAFICPGDGGTTSGVGGWVLGNYGAVRRVLKENGIEFMFNGLSFNNTPITSMVAATTSNIESNAATTFNLDNAYRPGMVADPYSFMEGMTIDLNTLSVERAANGLGSSTSAWSIAGNTALTPATAAYKQTLRWFISRRLGNRMGFGIAMHDSVNSQNPHSGGPYTGSFSHDYVCELLLELHNAGYIKLVTPSEWADFYLGKYAKGTDLIDNPQGIVPCTAVGDTAGIDPPFPMGWTAAADEGQAYSGNVGAFNSTWTGGNGANINNWYTSTTVGPAVVSEYGPGGGVNVNASLGSLNITQGSLPPGRYMLSVQHTNSGTLFQTLETWVIAKMKNNNFNDGWDNLNQTAWIDTTFVVEGSDNSIFVNKLAAIANGEWSGPRFWFDLPHFPANLLNNSATTPYKQFAGYPKGFTNATTPRNFWENPMYCLQANFRSDGASSKYSMVSLIYLGE